MLKGYFIERDQVGGGQMSEGAPFVQPQSCIINLFTQLYTNSTQFSGGWTSAKRGCGQKPGQSQKESHARISYKIYFGALKLQFSLKVNKKKKHNCEA